MIPVERYPLSRTMVVMARQVAADVSANVQGQADNVLAKVNRPLEESSATKIAITYAYI